MLRQPLLVLLFEGTVRCTWCKANQVIPNTVSGMQVRMIAEMLSPVLEAVLEQPHLAEPGKPLPSSNSTSTSSTASAAAAAAAAMLQLRLLEVFFFLPGAHLYSGCHGALLKLCCRQLQGLGGARILPGRPRL